MKASGWAIVAAVTAGVAADAALAESASMRGRFGRLEVVQAGSEDILRFGSNTVARPFGGELVDTLSIIGRQRVDDSDVFLVRGSRGADCPARYVAITTRTGAEASVSQPFGTCAEITASENQGGRLSVTMPDAAGAAATYVYDSGEMRALTPTTVAQAGTEAAPSTCRLYGAPGTTPEEGKAMLASFERDFPYELRKQGRAEKATLTYEDLQRLVAGMACLSSWPGADPLVPRTARPLFRSKRFGGDAFAALDAMARAPDTSEPMRVALRSFAARMYFHANRG